MSILNSIRNIFNLYIFDPKPKRYDYFNGSDNELKNIFLELEAIANEPINLFNQEDFKNKIKFLASEGLQIIEIFDIKPKNFKFTREEIDSFTCPEDEVKKPVKKKTVKKKKNDL